MDHKDPLIYHLGKKTRAFDALRRDLVVVAHEQGVSDGAALEVRGIKVSGGLEYGRVTPCATTGNEARGHFAYEATPGRIYRIDGVEYQPVRVTRFVRLEAGVGFRELTREEATALTERAQSKALPTLVGRAVDVDRAERIRTRMLERMPAELADRILFHTFARWYINNESLTDQDLEALLESERRKGDAFKETSQP